MKILFRSAVLIAAAAAALTPAAANASVTININEVGLDVLATGSGSLNLNGLQFSSVFGGALGITSNIAYVGTGLDPRANSYTGLIGPASFGIGSFAAFSSTTGTQLGINGGNFSSPLVFLPVGYTSGGALSTTATWLGASFVSLGLTPGSYVYTSPYDTFTVNIGPLVSGVPEVTGE